MKDNKKESVKDPITEILNYLKELDEGTQPAKAEFEYRDA